MQQAECDNDGKLDRHELVRAVAVWYPRMYRRHALKDTRMPPKTAGCKRRRAVQIKAKQIELEMHDSNMLGKYPGEMTAGGSGRTLGLHEILKASRRRTAAAAAAATAAAAAVAVAVGHVVAVVAAVVVAAAAALALGLCPGDMLTSSLRQPCNHGRL